MTRSTREPEELTEGDLLIELSLCRRVSPETYTVSFRHSGYGMEGQCYVCYRADHFDDTCHARLTSYHAPSD